MRLAGPGAIDFLPAEVALSSVGEAAVAFGEQDEDQPAVSDASVVLRMAGGRLARARAVPDAQQVLAVAFNGPTVELLTGTSPAPQGCCSSVAVSALQRGRFRRRLELVRGLTGTAVGRLVSLPGPRLLAAIATDRGVWVSQSAVGGGFAASRRLTGSSASPQTLAATSLPGGRSIVAWTATTGAADDAAARDIVVANGSQLRAPRAARIAVTVPIGHQVDEIGVASGAAAPTVAWIESWFDPAGAFHSGLAIADIGGRPRPRTFPVAGETAAGLSFASDARGDQVVAWKTCDALASCTVRAVSRAARRRFGRLNRLGTVDASQAPVAAVAPRGEALVGWIDHGHVLAADRRSAGGAFAPPRTVSATNYGADLTLAFGPNGQALAAWTQGTLAPSVIAAVHRP